MVRTTAQEAFQRVTDEIKSGGPLCDVLSTTDIGHCATLKSNGALEKYIPANAYELSEAYKNLDPEGYYHTTAAGMVVIAYATQKLKEEDVPQTWPDLVEPKWDGKLTVGHPAYSGYAGTWAVMMRKLYGWEFFDKLAKNNPEVVQSIGDTLTAIKGGKRNVGTASNAALLSAAAGGAAMAPIYPTDGAVLITAPSAIMKAARHPNAAKLFMEYLTGVDSTKIRLAHFNESIRPEETLLPRGRSAAQVKVVHPTVDEIVKGIPEVIKQWRDTFGA
jgi:iron(III) transport system substrate-binding protein